MNGKPDINSAFHILSDHHPDGCRIECNGAYPPIYDGILNPLREVLIRPHYGLSDFVINNHSSLGEPIDGPQDCQTFVGGEVVLNQVSGYFG